MLRKFFVSILVISMLFAFSVPVFAKTFTDVPEDHWAARYITLTTGMGLVDGFPDGTFRPEQQVKTGEFIKMMAARLTPEYEYKAPADGEHWAMQYARLINGLVVDAPSYTYDSLEAILSREEMAQMIYLFNITIQGTNHVTDADRALTHWSTMTDADTITEQKRYYVNYCISHEIINGFEDGSFRPKEGITRAQATKVLYLGIYN